MSTTTTSERHDTPLPERVGVRPVRLGDIAVDLGLIARDVLEQVIAERRGKKLAVGLGEALVSRGHLSRSDLDRVLTEQARRIGGRGERLLGQILIDSGVAPASSIDRALLEQRCRREQGIRSRLGSILLEQRVLTRTDLEKALAMQCGDSTAGSAVLPACHPTRFGLYDVQGDLGRGRFASVLRVTHAKTGLAFALKAFPPLPDADPVAHEKFLGALRTTMALSHPGILPLRDGGIEKGRPFLVMDLAPGPSLEDRLESGPLALEEAVDIVAELGRATDYAHRRDVVHGNIKPSNIFLENGEAPRLSDWTGPFLGPDGKGRLAVPDLSLSVPYWPPERIRTGMPPTVSGDVYALGALLYTLLAGHPPYDGATPADVMKRQASSNPTPLTRWLPDMPPELDCLCTTAMDKDPGHRTHSAGEFADQLEGWLKGDGPEASHQCAPIPRKRGCAALVALAAVLLAAAAWLL